MSYYDLSFNLVYNNDQCLKTRSAISCSDYNFFTPTKLFQVPHFKSIKGYQYVNQLFFPTRKLLL